MSTGPRGRENRGAVSCSDSGAVVQQDRAGGEADDESRKPTVRKVYRCADAEVGGDRSDAAADETADTPHAVQAGHDRAAEALLDRDAFGVHRHVGGAGGGPGEQQDAP